MKRIIALCLGCVMLFALAACTEKTSSGEVTNNIPEGKQIPDDAVLEVVITSHSSWPYREDWKVWEYIEEAIGGTVNVSAIPSSDFATKFPLMMTSPDTFPDVFGIGAKPAGFADYCEQGAFVALDDYPEFLEDYNAFWDGLPEKDQWMRDTRRLGDGKVYYAPIYGMERCTNLRGWLYRKDILEKNGLKAPETMDELYTVAKKLKAIYPNSYPFGLRSGLTNINVIGSSWKPNFRYSVYYDFENEKWCYGATESETMLAIVKFLNKMVVEKLAPADFFTINTSSWEELIATDRGFIMPEYQTRIDSFNNAARVNNPDFTLAAMKPPVAENSEGVAMVNKFNYDPTGFAVPNTGNKERIANAMRYVNWFYSDEGAELVSWGKEGETYEVIDGKKKFILGDDGETVSSLYGFKSHGAYLRVDPEMVDQAISQEQAATTDFMIEHTYPELDPTLYMEFSADDSELVAQYSTEIFAVVDENIQKFVIGQRPLSEWDTFQKELAELPIDELLAIYEETYNKLK